MLPNFLLPEQIVRENGSGPTVELASVPSKLLQLTLGITRVIEQQSLDVSIWGSVDGQNWGAHPVASFPQKFYCGVYSLFLDLSDMPDAQYLRVQWKVNRWGRGEPTPLFAFYVFGESVSMPALASSKSSAA